MLYFYSCFVLAASKDKKKCYFTHDWKDPNQYNDIPNLLQQNNNIHFPAEVKQSSVGFSTNFMWII